MSDSNRRPPITDKVVRGLKTITGAVSASPDETLIGIEEEHMDAEDRAAFRDALRACEWIDDLCRWHEMRRKERGDA